MVGNIVKKNYTTQTKSVNSSVSATQNVTPDNGKDLTQVTVNKLTASSALGNAATSDVAEGKTFSSSNGILLTGTGSIIPTAHIYGVEWAGESSSAMTRTDEAASFSAPVPYYSGMSATPQSPFDGLMPWAGMQKTTNSAAGTLVSIPKFYYKWTKTGAKMKLQIADQYVPGFDVSPAHANRGDGAGERETVYVGRYHCANSTYKSTTGVKPIVNITRASFRTNIHNLNSSVWQWDYRMLATIRMLYLVEYANWDIQATIGMGAATSPGNTMNNGSTDNIIYHTGTTATSTAGYGGTTYRYIENLWNNCYTFVDGIVFNNANIYIIDNPTNFSDSVTGYSRYVGDRVTTQGNALYIKSYNISNVDGYVLLPKELISSQTYITDVYIYQTTSGSPGILCASGGPNMASTKYGLFHEDTTLTATTTSSSYSSRLMYLP